MVKDRIMTILNDTEFSWAVAAGAILLAYTVYGAIYRLYLSPLAKFPGPKLVALTTWPEFYYDVVKQGTYIWEVEKMHQKYGPIVRVSPDELHCNDPAFYDTIYASLPQRRDKYVKWTQAPDCNNATGFTTVHDHHRMRRDALAPFFSMRNTVNLEDNVRACVDKFVAKMAEYLKTGEPYSMTAGSIATTMDVVTSYSFGEPFGLLDDETLAFRWRDSVIHIMKALPYVRNFPPIIHIMSWVPDSLGAKLLPDLAVLVGWKQRIRSQVADVLAFKGVYAKKDREKRTVIEEMRDSEKLPAQEKTLMRLSEEASILMIAGSEAPAKTHTITWFHLLDNPDKLARLRAELATVYTDPKAPLPSISVLEKLPYLSAVIHEGLRLHGGIVGRSPRLSPNPMQYKNYTIPPRTPISCMSAFQHLNTDTFPEPRRFIPERWLIRDEETGKEVLNTDLKKHLVSFGRGTRNCLGYNLGMAELRLMVAAVATRVELELFETDIDDVDFKRDWMIPQAKLDSQGVRVKVKAVHI